MDVFPADALGVFAPNPGHAVSRDLEASQFLDIEVHHGTGMRMLVAPHRRLGIEFRETVEAVGSQNPGDCGPADALTAGDLVHLQPIATTQATNPAHNGSRCAIGAASGD